MANRFDNISDAALVDEFGNVKAQIDALEKREKELRNEIVARFTDTPLMGARWTASILASTSKRLDTNPMPADGVKAGALWAADLARRMAEACRSDDKPDHFAGRTQAASVVAYEALATEIERIFGAKPPPENGTAS